MTALADFVPDRNVGRLVPAWASDRFSAFIQRAYDDGTVPSAAELHDLALAYQIPPSSLSRLVMGIAQDRHLFDEVQR